MMKINRQAKKHDTPNILFINPWIHDFTAYDFWAKPLGLLTLASILLDHGYNVSYIDCLDRFHQKAKTTDPSARCGRGPYLKTNIARPKGLEDVTRNFSCYGIKKEWFIEDLESLHRPDLVIVTSLMTYWHPGVKETIDVLRLIFPETPVILGGIYATLCRDHAEKTIGADMVVSGPGAGKILEIAGNWTGYKVKSRFDPDNLNTYPYLALHLEHKISFAPIITSIGCPFSCAYCASRVLNPKLIRRDPLLTAEEIKYLHEKYNVCDFAFYDDALLVDSENYAIPMLEKIISSGINVRFHTPNAIHIREITDRTARLMKMAGFKTIRIGLETGDFSLRTKDFDIKVSEKEFKDAVLSLKNAGFEKNEIGAYQIGRAHV